MLSHNSYGQRDSILAYTNGRMLFETNCSPCHGVHKEIIGPMLSSITKKRDTTWLRQFIRNSQAVIAAGDSDANYLYEQYHHQVMPSFKTLTKDQINNILLYIETESIHPTENVNTDQYIIQNSDAAVIRGKQIFQLQCAACHYINKESSYAPSLGSVTKRKSKKWLKAFIRNSQHVIQSGDAYAKHLFAAYNNHVMVSMEFLKDEEIESVLHYIEFASSSNPNRAGVNGSKISEPGGTIATTLITDSNTDPQKNFFGTLFIIIAVGGAVVHGILIAKLFRYLNRGL